MAKKTNKKTTKKITPKQRQAERQSSADKNRGHRRGRPVRSVQMRLPVDLVQWMDEQAVQSHMSRTQFVVLMMDAARKFDGAAEASGLFDDMQHHVEDAVVRALQSLPRPDLERLLAKKK